ARNLSVRESTRQSRDGETKPESSSLHASGKPILDGVSHRNIFHRNQRKGQWILGSCAATFAPSMGRGELVPKLLVQKRFFQELRVVGTVAGRLRLHRQAEIENVAAV